MGGEQMKSNVFDEYKIADLFIGYNDGKKEAERRSDFEQYYFNYNGLYEKILQNDKFLLLGKKGTGKSILGEYINKQATLQSNWFCKIASYKEFRFHELQHLQTKDIKPNEYIAIWEWIILLQIGMECIKDNGIEDEYKEKLIEFFKTNFFGLEITNNKIIEITKQNKIDGKVLSIPFINASIGGERGKAIKYTTGSYLEYLGDLKNTIIQALHTSQAKYTIIFDELDDQFRDEDLYKSNIISLIKVTDRINSLFIKRNIDCKVILLLRSDIFYILNDPDLNKIEEDSAVKIDWGNNDGDNSPLFNMILLKIRQSLSLQLDKNISNEKLYKLFFPDRLTFNDRSIKTAKFILGRTYLRPRDLVTYLNYIIREEPDSNKFTARAIRRVEKKYSAYLFKEIKNELFGHLSNEEIEESLRLLKQFKQISFTYKEIQKYYNKRKELYPHIVLEKTLKTLFDFGVLGNQWTSYSNGRKRAFYSFAHRENVEIDFDKKFNVHLGLRKELSLC